MAGSLMAQTSKQYQTISKQHGKQHMLLKDHPRDIGQTPAGESCTK